jgi:hypothetical protein
MAGPTGNAHQFLNLALCDGLAGRKANNRPHTLRPNVRSRSKTEVAALRRDVCFAPINGHRQAVSACPKSTNKKHCKM